MHISTTRRRPRRARYALAAVAAAASLALAACSSSGGSSGSASGSSGNVGWFFWVGSPGEQAVWKHNADLVPKTYPNLSVSLTTTSWPNYWTKLPLEASTNSMPCLAGLQYGYVGSVGNLFMPLNSLIKKYHYSLSPFESTMIKELSANGNLLALPYDFGPVVITYNKALFQAKGVPEPQNGWTWSQFLQDAQKLTGGGDYGYLPVTLGGTSLPLELAYDLSGVPDAYVKNGTFNLTNPDFIKGIQAQAELSYKYHVTPPYSTAPGWSSQEFTSGKVGMEVNGPWDLINLKSQANFPVGWVEFPAGPNGVHTYNEGSGFGITKDCKNPDAAFKALTVLVGSQALSYAGSQGRAFPARLSEIPSWAQFAGSEPEATMTTALKQAEPQEVTTNWSQFQTALGKYTPLVLSGQISAAQYAAQVQAASGTGTGVSPGDLSSILPSGG
jgi:multiple sugar transport system substrate-binding protein